MQAENGKTSGITAYLDFPQDDQAVGDELEIAGWVLSASPDPILIQILIDEIPAMAPIQRVKRPDVQEAFPSMAALNPEPGFATRINVSSLAGGAHTLKCVLASTGSAGQALEKRFLLKKQDEAARNMADASGVDPNLPAYAVTYIKQTRNMIQSMGEERAMAETVGGNFEAMGTIEFSLLLQEGLQKEHRVIDVGCGSGRLAFQLKDFLAGQYVGIDVVPDLLKYAQKICGRPDWKFYAAPGLTIPEPDDSADFICFFSVFTHLTQEDSYTYLADARRVIKRGGKIIFSFLEFAVASHWLGFENSRQDRRPDKVILQFFGRDAIEAWTEHLELRVLEVTRGDMASVRLDRPIRWEGGQETTGSAGLGQSYCIVTK